MKTGTLIRIALLLGIPALGAVSLEAAARWGIFGVVAPGLGQDPTKIHNFREFVAGRELELYVPRTYVSYALNPASPGVNSQGYRDHDCPRQRRRNVPRIACIGASPQP